MATPRAATVSRKNGTSSFADNDPGRPFRFLVLCECGGSRTPGLQRLWIFGTSCQMDCEVVILYFRKYILTRGILDEQIERQSVRGASELSP